MRQVVHEIQLELFQVEVSISEFEAKRKELKAKLAKLGAGEKTCTKCSETMDVEHFYRDKQKRDRLSSWCQDCIGKAEKARRKARAA